jgi:hypothetical protein
MILIGARLFLILPETGELEGMVEEQAVVVYFRVLSPRKVKVKGKVVPVLN